MKYNFDKIQTQANNHFIFIDALYQPGAYNRRAIGIQWGHSGEQHSIYTSRVDYVLTEIELQILALVKALDFIDEFVKKHLPEQQFTIHFKDDEVVELFYADKIFSTFIKQLVTDSKLKLAFFERQGYEIELKKNFTFKTLTNALNLALYDYQLTNDFQTETLYLSSVVSKAFENMFFDLMGEKLIEYISPTEPGLISANKRMITVEDEMKMDSIALQLFPTSKYPPKTIKKLSEMRRSCLIVRDADLVLMIAPIFNGDSLDGIDSLVYAASKQFHIPIFILDSETLTWFTRSKTEKRDLVKATHLPKLKAYLNIGVYCAPGLDERIWETFKKIFKS